MIKGHIEIVGIVASENNKVMRGADGCYPSLGDAYFLIRINVAGAIGHKSRPKFLNRPHESSQYVTNGIMAAAVDIDFNTIGQYESLSVREMSRIHKLIHAKKDMNFV